LQSRCQAKAGLLAPQCESYLYASGMTQPRGPPDVTHSPNCNPPNDHPIPLVSVVMPVWRPKPEFLRIAVQSVLGQTLRQLELVIVEDPSDVSSSDVLDEFEDDRIRHFLNPARSSIVEQLNIGLAKCRGEFVARFDADDVCHSRRLEKQVDFLTAHADVSVVGSQIGIIDEQGRRLGFRSYPAAHQQIVAAMGRFNPIAHPSVMFRKQPVIDAGGYRLIQSGGWSSPLCQDYDLWSRLARRGIQFANHADLLVEYRIHSAQLKSENVREVLRAILAVKKLYWRDDMGLRARLRMYAERLLLVFPRRFVLALFMRFQIQNKGRSRGT
jgi:glycosyltransferase involved in cell wall biosynthesis